MDGGPDGRGNDDGGTEIFWHSFLSRAAVWRMDRLEN